MKICPVCSTEYADDVRFCPSDGQTLRSSSPGTDLVGQVLADRYHVVKKLGEGGMGQVYLAEHVKMGRKSAIKVMSPSMVHDPDAVARFNREAANASRISHPNVCAVYDFGETPEGIIYLAMEFVEGEPLTDLLAREGSLPVPRAGAIFLHVADALQAAHDLGIVHRDLKPDNIMVSRGRDGTDHVKVVDFGIAKAVGGGAAQKVTKTGLVVGTPEFMSPEQLAGDTVDGRSDLYALALVLFKMLTGQLPFAGTTAQDTMISRLTDEPAKLVDVRPDVGFPPGLQATLDTALTRNPADRYQSTAKFASDVATVLGLQRGSRPSPFPVTRPDAGDARTELLRRSTATPSARRHQAKKRPLVPIVAGAIVIVGGVGAALALRGGAKQADGRAPTHTTIQRQQAPSVDSASARGAPAAVPPPAQPAARESVKTRTPRRVPPPASPARPRIDVTRARELLDNLFFYQLEPKTAQMVRDSANDIYVAPGVSQLDRAYAAF
ncbi:MAG TPA: serine/threonine-protein kinase, partial [Gemmatimonadales bacterium]|nr:serine/threonine-protein kinase [Gemmatimonadales bacterium]